MRGQDISNDHGAMPAIALTLAFGLAVWTVSAMLFSTPFPAVVACAVFGMIAAVALPGYARQRPRPRFGAANGITLFRASLIAFVCGFAAEPPAPADPSWWVATATAGLALALDGVDGWVARRTRRASAFGARFDMETDALAALILCLVLWRAELTGSWIILIGLMRYFFIASGWILDWMQHPLPPRSRRRVLCAVQGTLLVSCLIPILPAIVPPALGAAALGITAASFLIDTAWLVRRRLSES